MHAYEEPRHRVGQHWSFRSCGRKASECFYNGHRYVYRLVQSISHQATFSKSFPVVLRDEISYVQRSVATYFSKREHGVIPCVLDELLRSRTRTLRPC